jgi:hypothetical protein
MTAFRSEAAIELIPFLMFLMAAIGQYQTIGEYVNPKNSDYVTQSG